MNNEVSRREFIALGVASVLVGIASLGWDAIVNEGRPAESDEEPPSRKEQPCLTST